METPVSGGLVKNAGAIGWSDVDTAEAALIERCTTGDEAACADLVNTHQRMVYASSERYPASAASPPFEPGSIA